MKIDPEKTFILNRGTSYCYYMGPERNKLYYYNSWDYDIIKISSIEVISKYFYKIHFTINSHNDNEPKFLFICNDRSIYDALPNDLIIDDNKSNGDSVKRFHLESDLQYLVFEPSKKYLDLLELKNSMTINHNSQNTYIRKMLNIESENSKKENGELLAYDININEFIIK